MEPRESEDVAASVKEIAKEVWVHSLAAPVPTNAIAWADVRYVDGQPCAIFAFKYRSKGAWRTGINYKGRYKLTEMQRLYAARWSYPELQAQIQLQEASRVLVKERCSDLRARGSRN
jgi:hypothetical protein